MSFMAQQYNCCPGACGDATLDMQTAILGAIAAVATQIDNIDGSSGGTATGTKQDEILIELDKLTSGLRTN